MQKISSDWWARIALAAIVAATTLRPGDAPWIHDEPLMMGMAIQYNRQGCDLYGIHLPFTPSPFGLEEKRGIRFGPVSIWIDQIFLAITHNLEVILAMRAALVSAVNALALYWLSRVLRLTPWLAVVTMLSPWLWFYNRHLWDNSYGLPLSTLLLAAYGDFLTSRRPGSLRLAVLCSTLLGLIHFMSIPVIFPVVLHLLIFEFRAAWRLKWSMSAIVAAAGGLSWPYWHLLSLHHHREIPTGTSPWLGWFYPLLGAHHLTAAGLGNILGDSWQSSTNKFIRPILLAAQWFSLLAYPAVWAGMVLALPRAWRAIRHNATAATMDKLLLLALGTVICQCALDGIEHVYQGPLYYNGTWIAYALLAWLTVQTLARWRGVMPAAMSAHAASLLAVTAIAAHTISANGGMRSDNYGTALSNQLQAVRRIKQFSNASPRTMDIPQWNAYPFALDVLLDLTAPPPGFRPTRKLVIRYRNAFPGDARIAVDDRIPNP